jgi:hypothetical protein
MTEDQFWDVVARTAQFQGNTAKQTKALENALDELPDDEIVEFEGHYAAQMNRAYTWELWGAAYVVHGGASDDTFEYFRNWLISKGRAVFEQVLADPDSLADLVAPGSSGVLEYEEFASVARNIWKYKTGFRVGEMPSSPRMIRDDQPSGMPFEEDDAYLATRYPKLWQRFGQTPLGG